MNSVKIDMRFLSAMEKVFSNDTLGKELTSVSALKNERLNFQLSVRSAFSMKKLRYEVKSALAPYVQVRLVDYAKGYYNTRPDSDGYTLFQDGRETLFPDILRPCPFKEIFLYTDAWTTLWFTIYATEDIPVGEHPFTVQLYDEEMLVAEQTLIVRILDARLEENDLIISNWLYYDGLMKYYGVEAFSEEFYNILDPYMRSAFTHGINTLYLPLFTPPLDTQIGLNLDTIQTVKITKNKDVYTFDFSELKKLIGFAMERGAKYFELSHLATQWGAKFTPKIMAMVDSEDKQIFGWDMSALGEEYKTFLKAFLPELIVVLKELKIKDRCFLHISDEPLESHLETYLELKNLIKEYVEGVPVMDALSSYDFFEKQAVDIPVVDIVHTEKFQEKQIKHLVYYFCANHKQYVPNRFLNMPSQRNRILGFQLYLNDVLGFLHWGFNYYKTYLSKEYIDPFMITDAGGLFQSGDSFVVYPTMDCVWESLRLEVFSDGIEDYRALKTLERKRGKEFTKKLLEQEGLDGYTRYPRSSDWHLSFREKLNELIAED